MLTIVFALASMGYFQFVKGNELRRLNEKEKGLKKELKSYQKIIKRVDKLNKRISELKSKLKIINELRSKKTGPVHLLDEIAMAVPRNKLWLKSLKESKGILRLSGTAKNNEVVAEFMRNLERSKYIKTVDLDGIRVTQFDQFNIKVSNFKLTCKTITYKEKKKEGVKKRKRRRRRR